MSDRDVKPENVLVEEGKPKRRAKGPSPTARTLAWCRKRGWLAGVVERRLPKLFVTVDLFGFADVAAIDPHRGKVVLIQACAGTDMSHRQAKLEGRLPRPLRAPEPPKEAARRAQVAEAVRTCVRAGVVVECWGWRRLTTGRVRWEVLRRRAQLDGVGAVAWEEIECTPALSTSPARARPGTSTSAAAAAPRAARPGARASATRGRSPATATAP